MGERDTTRFSFSSKRAGVYICDGDGRISWLQENVGQRDESTRRIVAAIRKTYERESKREVTDAAD